MQLATINLKGNTLMKKVFVSIACCAMIAPLALAKDPTWKNSKRPRAWHIASVSEQPVTITATSTRTRVEEGAAASYQPPRTLVVQQNVPGRYVLDGRGHVFNRKGEVIRTAIKPGTTVHVYFATNAAGMQTIDHVVVD